MSCSMGDIRLAVAGSVINGGKVEMCIDGSWIVVCGNMFDNLDAEVACRQLGYPHGGKLCSI